MKFIIKFLDYFEEALILIMLSYMAIMNFVNVVYRYTGLGSISWTEELTITVFVWVTMLGIGAGFKRNAHLGMSFVVDFFHGKARAIMVLLSVICSLVLMGLVVYYGIEVVQNQLLLGSKTPILQMPQPVQSLSMPVGGIFIIIRILQSGYKEVKMYWTEDGGKKA